MMIYSKLLRFGAPVLIVLSIIGLIYGKGRMDEAHEAELSELRHSLQIEEEARIADAYQALASSKRLSQLDTKVKTMEEYVEELEDANRVCLSNADTDSLRNLWE